MELPTISNYGQGRSKQWNTTRVDVGEITIWFSYKTPVAFHMLPEPMVVHRNDWGSTTGKHLNWIDGGGDSAKAARLPKDDFNRMLEAACNDGEA